MYIALHVYCPYLVNSPLYWLVLSLNPVYLWSGALYLVLQWVLLLLEVTELLLELTHLWLLLALTLLHFFILRLKDLNLKERKEIAVTVHVHVHSCIHSYCDHLKKTKNFWTIAHSFFRIMALKSCSIFITFFDIILMLHVCRKF